MSDERELAQAFAAREAWAYEAAYREFGRALYGAALQVLRDPLDAQDCVHDVLLRLWRRGDAYRPARGSLRAFLAVSVRNEALSRARRRSNRERIVQALERPAGEGDVGAEVADRESIRSAMSGLGEKQRRAIELAYFGHLTHEQIARALDEPLGTVKSRISGALRKLREAFAREGAADAG